MKNFLLQSGVRSQCRGCTNIKIKGFPELPMFPGIPSEKLLGKKIVMSALDLQTIRNGKIKQELHIENYPAAIHQMLNDEPDHDFGFKEDFLMDSKLRKTRYLKTPVHFVHHIRNFARGPGYFRGSARPGPIFW